MEINNVSKEVKKSVKTRIITGFFFALISVPCIILGGWFFVAYIAAICGLMTFEFLHIAKEKDEKLPMFINIFVFIMMYSFVFWIFTEAAEEHGIVIFNSSIKFGIGMKDIRVSTLGLAFFVAMLFLFVISFEKFDIKRACYIFTMGIFISISLQAVLFLRFCPQYLYNEVIAPNTNRELFYYENTFQESMLLTFVAGGALLNDIYAFFVGILFGKHKINPRISPKKTWEGFIGGVVLTTLTGIGFVFLCDAINVPVLKGILDIEHWYFTILFSIIIAVVSVLGDFMFSAIKRYFNVKDFSNILPGHGGILDRFDSVLITSLICCSLILFIAYMPLAKIGLVK